MATEPHPPTSAPNLTNTLEYEQIPYRHDATSSGNPPQMSGSCCSSRMRTNWCHRF